MEAAEEFGDEMVYLNDFKFNQKKCPHPTILLVGKRFSGKSVTSVSIASKFDVPRWAAFCGTKDTEDFWAEKFGSSATVRGPNDAGKGYLKTLIRFQEVKGRLYKKHLKEPVPRRYTIGLIFDDVTSNKQFSKGPLLEDLFSNGRHYNAVIIISCQYLKQLPPAVRLNTDYLFIMHNSKKLLKILYEEYVEEPDEFGMFLQLAREVTGQRDSRTGKDLYNALVFSNLEKSTKLSIMFNVYRSEGMEAARQVRLGDAAWREYNATHYRDSEEEAQKRIMRKNERAERVRKYQQKRLARWRAKQNALYSGIHMDLDVYNDSDSEPEPELEPEEEEHDVVLLKKRRGRNIRVHLRQATMPETDTGYVEDVDDPNYIHPSQRAHGSHGQAVPGSGAQVPGAHNQTDPYGSGQAQMSSYNYGQASAYQAGYDHVDKYAGYGQWSQPQAGHDHGQWSQPQAGYDHVDKYAGYGQWSQPQAGHDHGQWSQPQTESYAHLNRQAAYAHVDQQVSPIYREAQDRQMSWRQQQQFLDDHSSGAARHQPAWL